MDKKIDRKAANLGNSFHEMIRGQVDRDVSCNKEKISLRSEERSLEEQVGAWPKGMNCCSSEYVSDHSSLLSLQPWIFRKEFCQDDADKGMINGDFSDKCSHESNGLSYAFQAEFSPTCISPGYGRRRGRTSLRSRQFHRYSIKPVTSVGNCLIPLIYNEHFELEEYVLNSVPSSMARTMRPLIITDGDRKISKSTYDTCGMSSKSELVMEDSGMTLEEMGAVVGIPHLPQFKSPKQKIRKAQHWKPETSNSQRICSVAHSQDSLSQMLLFCLGINIGVISTIMSNRREVARLNDMLKNTKNLVQDLQEELEMKDSMTVKELDNETEAQILDKGYSYVEDSIDLLSSQVPASCHTLETKTGQQHTKTVEISELSGIEAELEAELERLELNINSSSLEGKMSALGELDPDILAVVVHGELRAPGGQAEADRDKGTSTNETPNVNYAVSPRELSLRLHEIIQLRMEERIAELEGELHHSQKQMESMKAEQIQSQNRRPFSNSETWSCSDPQSPNLSAQPLCLNLSGDALHAYGEAYEEFMKIADEREQPPPTANTGKDADLDVELRPDWSQIPGEECIDVDNRSRRDFSDQSDDEEAKMLVQQIVEMTRKGSPAVVMHAQRMLFAMEE